MADTATASPATGAAKPKTKQVPMTAAQAVDAAAKMFTQGRIKPAADLARQIVKNHPDNADAHNILGVAVNALGDPKEGAALVQRAIRLRPGNPVYYANLGEIERRRGRAAEARKALTKAIELDPKQASAQNNLGILHYDNREYRQARDRYLKAIEANPNFAEAYNNLANVSRFLGDHAGAQKYYQKALQNREVYPEAYNNLGTLLRDLGKFAEAEHAYRKAILQNSRYMDAYNNLANLLFMTNRDVDALRVLSDALRVQGNNPVTLTITARVQLRRGNYEAAEQAAKRALEANPKNADALIALGQLYHETDRYDEAIKVLEEALKFAPNSPEGRNFYGVALKSVGRLEEGKAEILKAIELNPKSYGAYANLNDLVDYKEAPELVEKMEGIFASTANPNDPRLMPLHFGFGKALEDLGQHPRALEHYLRGARQKRAQLNYSEEETVKFFRDIQALFGPEIFANRPFKGLPNDNLIFIVGMPRSGSTLVEQILSSHPAVFGAGEVKYLARALGLMRDRFPHMAKYPQVVPELEAFHYNLIGQSYLKQIMPTAGSARKITDKLLTNYFFVGLIHLIFPNAKFVHTMRNPVDTCLSTFTKLFKDDMPHSYDFGELGRYYKEYEAIMDHWHKVLPEGTILDIRYEDVVADTEAKARELIAFVGLDWDPACVEFHKSSRPVKTASVAQVRKPIYTQSVERWRKYGPGLQPLVDALGYVPQDEAAPKPKTRGSKAATAEAVEPAAKKKRVAKATAKKG